MSRKGLAIASVFVLAFAFVGCPKKQPAPPPPAPTPAPTPPPQEVMPPTAPVGPEEPMESPLDKSLMEATDFAHQQGLIGDVFFDFDKYNLKPEARDRLAKNAQWLNSDQGGKFIVTIEGHCDERGTNEYNLALGERRANAARDYLVSLGVDAARLRTVSFGEEKPFCMQHDESCWSKNRRAHFVFSGRVE